MNRPFYSLSLFLLTLLFVIPSTAHATKYSGGTIELYLTQQQRVNLSEMLAEAMNQFGAGYPYSWKSSNPEVFRTTMPSRTHCNVYACGIGTAELTYHGEYYRNGTIYDIDCVWTVNVTIKNNGGGDDSAGEGSDVTEPIGETWIDDNNYDCSWYNVGLKNFNLSTPEQLAGLSYLVNNGADFENKTVTLANDISLEGKRWIGIGSASGKCFKGTFDGKKYTISGLSIAIRKDDDYAGFFGNIDHATIQNLVLEGVLNANTACGWIGGLVGHSGHSDISNITCNIPIYINNNLKNYGNNFKLNLHIGGIVGSDSYSSINHTKYNGEIILTQYPKAAWYSKIDIHVGGLIGTCNNDNVRFSESKCSEICVESPTWEKYEFLANEPTEPKIDIGGLIGWGGGDNIVKCCKSQCDLINIISHGFPFSISPRGFIGTLIGFTTYERAVNILENCLGILNSLKIKENKMDVFFYANNCARATYCFCNSDVSISQEMGNQRVNYKQATFYKLEEMKTDAFLDKLNEYSENGLLDGAIWEKADDGFPQLKPNAGMDEDDPVVIYDETWQDEGNYDTSWFTDLKKEFTINTPQELAGLAHIVTWTKPRIKLGADIDMSGKMWIGIADFQGCEFDGQGHKITGLNILAHEDDERIGFFKELCYSKVSNLTIEGAINGEFADGDAYIGGLAGTIRETNVSNIKCNISININNDVDKYDNGFSSSTYIGGIIGSASNSSISKVSHNGKIIINQYPKKVSYDAMYSRIGGIIGYAAYTNIENAESRCSKIKFVFPGSKEWPKYYPSINVGSICGLYSGNNHHIQYSSGICKKIEIDNVITISGEIGGTVGKSKYCNVKNCYGIIQGVKVNKTSDFYYFANNCTSATDCFSNSDVKFESGGSITKSFEKVKTYTTEEMKTETFLERLNKYSIKNLGSPVWESGEDGFPQLIALHKTPDKKVTSITLNCTEISIAPREENQLTATILPEDATDKTVSWKTDNAAVATVSEDGLVTAVGQGTATITCRANDSSGVYATCEVTVKERASWAGKYLVSGQHEEGSSVTKVYPDNFEMTIEEKNGGTYITSMFGNDLTTWNEGGFRLEMNDDGTASVNLTNDDVLDYVSDTGLLYAMYVWDDETGDWCDTWSLRLNEDGTISLGEFYVAAFTWDETDETWRGRTEALYYDLLAVKDDGSAVHEIAQNQPGIHVHNGVIELDETTDVTVYKENGMIVYQGKTDRVDGLAKGMYIVCVGEQRKKVMVK